MDQIAIERIESALQVTLTPACRQLPLSRTVEVKQLDSALEYVLTPWTDPDEINR